MIDLFMALCQRPKQTLVVMAAAVLLIVLFPDCKPGPGPWHYLIKDYIESKENQSE